MKTMMLRAGGTIPDKSAVVAISARELEALREVVVAAFHVVNGAGEGDEVDLDPLENSVRKLERVLEELEQ